MDLSTILKLGIFGAQFVVLLWFIRWDLWESFRGFSSP
jgi:hypothetical protein